MEKKAEPSEVKNKEEEKLREKVVYKVVPVPYYYPVPVDAEWYYKNYDRINQHAQFYGYDDQHFEHFPPPPPPGFPFSRSREHHMFPRDRYEFPDRYMRSPSPPPLRNGMLPRQQSQAPSKEEPMVPNRPMSTNGAEETKNTGDAEDNTKEKEVEVKNETEESGEENENFNEESDKEVTSDDKQVEVKRKRKRYLMTFPYDQKKKNKDDEQVVDESKSATESLEDTDIHEKHETETKRCRESEFNKEQPQEKHRMMYSPGHQPMIPSHVPYVMLPVRPPTFMSSEMVRESRYVSDRGNHIYDERRYTESDASDFADHDSESKDEKKEIRFHPNGRRARTVFTRQQLLTLNNVFEKHPFVSGERMSELSDQLGLDRKIVKIWFQNKRQYARKKGSLLDREEDYYYEYTNRYNSGSAPPTMAERWKN